MVWRTKLSQSYPPRLAKAYGILHEHARELRERAVEQGLPIPHAPLPDYYVSSWTASVLCWWIEVLEKEAIEWQECMRIQRSITPRVVAVPFY